MEKELEIIEILGWTYVPSEEKMYNFNSCDGVVDSFDLAENIARELLEPIEVEDLCDIIYEATYEYLCVKNSKGENVIVKAVESEECDCCCCVTTKDNVMKLKLDEFDIDTTICKDCLKKLSNSLKEI